jgi:hypothetical protein
MATQTIARHHTIDVHVKFCVGNSSSVTIWLRTRSGIAKLPIFSRNLEKSCVFMQEIFLGTTLEPDWKYMAICKLYVLLSFWFKGGARENNLYNDVILYITDMHFYAPGAHFTIGLEITMKI